MKIRKWITTFVLGLALTSAVHSNGINSSWSVNTLKAQALTYTVKQARLKNYSQPKLQLKQLPHKQMRTNKELLLNKALTVPDETDDNGQVCNPCYLSDATCP